jgi:hypothetical protein
MSNENFVGSHATNSMEQVFHKNLIFVHLIKKLRAVVNPKVHYCVHNIPSLDPILSPINMCSSV